MLLLIFAAWMLILAVFGGYLCVGINFFQDVAELFFEGLLLLADHAAEQLLFQPLLSHREVHQGNLCRRKIGAKRKHKQGNAFRPIPVMFLTEETNTTMCVNVSSA